MPQPDPFDQQQRTLISARTGAQRDADRLILALDADPNNKALQDDLAALEAEIARYDRDLRHLDAKRRALAEQAARRTSEVLRAEVASGRKAAASDIEALSKAAVKAEKLVIDLAHAMADIERHGAALQRQALAVGRIVCTNHPKRAAFAGSVQQHATSYAAPMQAALADAVKGTVLERFIDFPGLRTPSPSVADVVALSAERATADVGSWALPKPDPVAETVNPPPLSRIVLVDGLSIVRGSEVEA
jgi:hypothetical protein